MERRVLNATAQKSLALRDRRHSRPLSGEFTRELGGRHVSFRVRPFVFREMSAYAAQLGRNHSVGDHPIRGGFPKTVEFADHEVRRRYPGDLDDTVVLDDIMNRYAIRKVEIFKDRRISC